MERHKELFSLYIFMRLCVYTLQLGIPTGILTLRHEIYLFACLPCFARLVAFESWRVLDREGSQPCLSSLTI
jgi:hypothetical protein